MNFKILAGAGVAAAILLMSAPPAWAHVTVDPDSAAQGAEITLRFRVPNEVTNANVTKVDIALPTDHPLLGVAVEPIAGWSSTVTEAKLNPPAQTDDGPVTQAVSEIVWTSTSGGGTLPDQFQEFPVLVQQLPKDTIQVVFKAIQTYSDGTVVRWIEPVVAVQASPDHPTPILTLSTASGSSTGATTPTTAPGATNATVDVTKLAQKSSVSSAHTLGVIGIVVGALGLIVALVAVTRRPGSKDGTASTP
jgi:uncharacterized protein YcnI